jgi:hypothetical protein
MTGNVIDASEVLDVRDEELDAVAGGWLPLPLRAFTQIKVRAGQPGGQNDAAAMFQQILQQLTQG